jgi:hypothetical protein
MVKVKTSPEDPHFESYFRGRKRCMEIQLQGRFKRQPVGEVYIAGEASGPLNPISFHVSNA